MLKDTMVIELFPRSETWKRETRLSHFIKFSKIRQGWREGGIEEVKEENNMSLLTQNLQAPGSLERLASQVKRRTKRSRCSSRKCNLL